MKVLLLNEGYSDNLGDQAIKDSLHYLLNKNDVKEIIFQDFTRNIDRPIVIDISTNKKIKKDKIYLIKILKTLVPAKLRWLIKQSSRVIQISKQKYDLVVIGGGQLILSNSTFAIAMFVWVFFLRLFGNKNIVLFGVGSGTKFRATDKLLYNYALHHAKDIYVRDHKSQEILRNIFNIKANFVYDIAFMHNKLQKVDIINKSNILLGIISFDVYSRYNKTKITKDDFFESWIKLLKDNNIKFSSVKLFYTTQDDRLASLEFQEYVVKTYKLNLELIETNKKDILIYEISKSKIVISARMHALILGLTYGCEIVIYMISDKLKEFNEMFSNNFNLENLQTNIELNIKEVINE